jgi:phosphopantetheinyl transferase (holo-ACP synthase)
MQINPIDFLSRQITLSEFLVNLENQNLNSNSNTVSLTRYFSAEEINLLESLKPQQRCARYLMKELLAEYLSYLRNQRSQTKDLSPSSPSPSIQDFCLLKTDLGAPYIAYKSPNQQKTLNSIQISITHEKELVWVALAIDQALFVSELSILATGG